MSTHLVMPKTEDTSATESLGNSRSWYVCRGYIQHLLLASFRVVFYIAKTQLAGKNTVVFENLGSPVWGTLHWCTLGCHGAWHLLLLVHVSCDVHYSWTVHCMRREQMTSGVSR